MSQNILSLHFLEASLSSKDFFFFCKGFFCYHNVSADPFYDHRQAVSLKNQIKTSFRSTLIVNESNKPEADNYTNAKRTTGLLNTVKGSKENIGVFKRFRGHMI